MDGQASVLASAVTPVFDISNYGLRDWLQLLAAIFGIIGSVFGLWKTWRYSKWQIAKRLIEYLEAGEKDIIEARGVVLRHLRYEEPLVQDPNLKMHQCVKAALEALHRGQPSQAEEQLTAFVALLTQDAKVGRQYMKNADRQAATALLFVGLIAKTRSESDTARSAWTAALRHDPEDAEAVRYLGELDLAQGNSEAAWQRFAKAVALAPSDKLLRAETSEQRAEYLRSSANPKKELNALHDCAPNFADVAEHKRAAQAFARAGEIENQLNHSVQAPQSFTKAHKHYHLARDTKGMGEMRQRLEELGEDISALPSLEGPSRRPIPWFWIRLGAEVLVLAVAIYLTFMR